MKKIVLIIAVIAGSITAKAQQEISVDLADALILKTLELNYEYYLSDQSSVGLSALFNFNSRSADIRYNEDNMFTPYFRHYFSNSQNWDYFGEVNIGINSGKRRGVSYTDGALGVAVGAKYISDGGLVLSALGGIGRNMFSTTSYEFVPRLGFNIGYRF